MNTHTEELAASRQQDHRDAAVAGVRPNFVTRSRGQYQRLLEMDPTPSVLADRARFEKRAKEYGFTLTPATAKDHRPS